MALYELSSLGNAYSGGKKGGGGELLFCFPASFSRKGKMIASLSTKEEKGDDEPALL